MYVPGPKIMLDVWGHTVRDQRSLHTEKIILTAVRLCLAVIFVISQPAVGGAKKKKADEPLQDLKYKVGDEQGNDLRTLKAELLATKSEKLAMEQMTRLLKKY